MNSQNFLDWLRVWLSQHGLTVLGIAVLTIAALKAAAVLNRRLVARLFKERADPDSQKLARTVTTSSHWLITVGLLVLALSFLLHEVGVNTDAFLQLAVAWLLTNGLGIALIVVITFVALEVSGILAGRLVAFLNRGKRDAESQKRADTLTSVIRWVMRTGILLLASVMLLGQLGVQIGPILAAAGVVGIAVGFGAQNLVRM